MRARLEIGFPIPVVSSRSRLTRRSAALRSIGISLGTGGYQLDTMNRSIIAGVLIASAAIPSTASAQLTVYSGLPLSGAARGQTQAINDGARQAQQEAGGMAAGQPVRLVTLNDATRQAGSWTPERVAANARRAAKNGIALIGAFNSGASAIAIPITNEAALPMISPSNTAIGLTTGGPGTSRGEPGKYYPAGCQLLPHHAERQGPGRGPGHGDERPRLQADRRRQRP